MATSRPFRDYVFNWRIDRTRVPRGDLRESGVGNILGCASIRIRAQTERAARRHAVNAARKLATIMLGYYPEKLGDLVVTRSRRLHTQR